MAELDLFEFVEDPHALTLEGAQQLDAKDSLSQYRDEFYFPKKKDSDENYLYFTGNSLGLQPRTTSERVNQELSKWAQYGVLGHFTEPRPWFSYHENLTNLMAQVVGAKPVEVVVMNTLSVNLHLMMVSFYQPRKSRTKILIEKGCFPSDRYAVDSQARFHGLDPNEVILELTPRAGEKTLRTEDILETLETKGEEIALVLLGQVNYRTGQAFEHAKLIKAAHEQGCYIGLDLAHGAGNLQLNLHEEGPDFAVWCTYKYLNGGPGNLSGCFVHERHARSPDLPRFAGWWGNEAASRFEMKPQFQPMAGAEGWQLSNPPILEMASLLSSLEIFQKAGMKRLRNKSRALTRYLELLMKNQSQVELEQITPSDPSQRGAQLSFLISQGVEQLGDRLFETGVICDVRKPDVLRVAPAPLYNSFEDVFRFQQAFISAHQKR